MSCNFAKHTMPTERAMRTETRISFQMTCNMSRGRISSSAMPRMTVTEAWLPAFPPVPMIIGTQAMRTVGRSS